VTEILFSFQCCDVGYEPGELPDCSTPQYLVRLTREDLL